MQHVGVLVERHVLTRALRGRSREQLHLYDQAAQRHGIRPIFFSIDRINLKRRRVRGFVHAGRGRYRRLDAPLPRVIHRRIIVSGRAERTRLQRLSALAGVTMFNPPTQRSKLFIVRLLSQHPHLRAAIPKTIKLTSPKRTLSFLREAGTIFAKPALGSVGKGVYKIRRLLDETGGERFELHSWRGARRRLTLAALRRWFAAHQKRGYIVQQGIDLARYQGRPFDIRVTVQRDGQGAWRVTGMVARIARAGKPVTNLGRGGSTQTLDAVLASAFPASDRTMLQERLRRLALEIAHALSRRWRGLADLGLDLALDQHGKVWFLEANFREQRPSDREANGRSAVQRQYAQPMAYAAYLLRV